jgi:chromosome segregation ATPase
LVYIILQTELEKLSGELKSLQAKLSKEISEKGDLELRLQTLDAEHQSVRQTLDQMLQELDTSKSSSKFFETRLNESAQELESKANQVSRLEFDLGTREQECQNLLKEIDSLRQCLNDEQKEIATLRDRERSQKELEQQMIVYQKDLQEQLRASKPNFIHLFRIFFYEKLHVRLTYYFN